MPLEIGTRLGTYEIRLPLGSGGVGEVYRAIDTKLGRSVAIKVLRPEVSKDTEHLMRFEREARNLASLNHPGIASIYYIDSCDGLTFLVMELVPGQTLSERLQVAGPMRLSEALNVA